MPDPITFDLISGNQPEFQNDIFIFLLISISILAIGILVKPAPFEENVKIDADIECLYFYLSVYIQSFFQIIYN